GIESGLAQLFQSGGHSAENQQQVEIFGAPPYARMLVDGKRAADCEGDARVMQDEEYFAVEFPLFHVPIRLSGGSNRKMLILLHSYFDAIHIRTCRPFS